MSRDPERHRIRERLRYRANPGPSIQRRRLWYKNNTKRAKQGAKLRYQRNRAQHVINVREERKRLRRLVIQQLGGKCSCCGEHQHEFLTIDHVNNDGREHRRATGGSSTRMYRDIRRQGFPRKKYQVHCFNCNLAKSIYGTCPHQRRVPA